MHRPTKTKTLNLLETKALVIVLILVVTYLLARSRICLWWALCSARWPSCFFRCKKPLYYAITVSGWRCLIWVVFHFVLNVSF